MTYDPTARGLLLLLVQNPTGRSAFTGTWEFAGGNWTNLTSASAVAPDVGGWLTYDYAAGYALLAQGSQTWAFANDTWTQLQPTVEPAPSGNDAGAMFYDAVLGSAILWDGTAGKTWEFHAGEWTQVNTTAHPPTGLPMGSAYDAEFGYGVVFGPVGEGDNSTWAFENGTWQNVTMALGPAPDYGTSGFGLEGPPAFAYDSSASYFVLLDEWWFPGLTGSPSTNQTWILHDPLRGTLSVGQSVADVGQSLTYTVAVSGGYGPYAVRATSSPPGCAIPPVLNATSAVACLLSQAGPFVFNATMTDTVGQSLYVELPLVVNSALTASSGVTPNPATVGVPLAFDVTASGGTSPVRAAWAISPGNGSVLGTTGSYTFTGSGTYTARLTVSDGAGAEVHRTISIGVYSGVVLEARANRSVIDAGLSVGFTATATGGRAPISYAWQFGDGGAATAADASHVYAVAGTYDATVWANDTAASVTEFVVPVQVNPALAVVAIANTSTTELYAPVTFEAHVTGGTGPFTYWWDFGSEGSSSGATVSYEFLHVGPHPVSLVVNDSLGVSRSGNLTVEVTPVPSSGPAPHSTGESGGVPTWEYLMVAGTVAAGAAGVLVLLTPRRPRRPAPTAPVGEAGLSARP